MSLWTQIDEELIEALKSKNEKKRDTLRMLKSALKNAAIETQTETINDEEVIKIIGREIKRRKESIEAFTNAGKPDLAAEEQVELEILQKYMPAQMSEEELTTIVKEYLVANPTPISEMGRAMGALSANLKGKADLGKVSKILRENIG